MLRSSAIVFAAALAWVAQAAPAGRVLDRVVAVVSSDRTAQSKVITLKMLELEARIALIQSSRGETEADSSPLDLETLRAALVNVIGQQLAFDQARLQGVGSVDDNEVAAQVDRLVADLANPDGGLDRLRSMLAREHDSIEDVRDIARRELWVSQFMQTKLTIESHLTSAEVEAFATAHATELARVPERDRLEAAQGGAKVEHDRKLERGVIRQLYARARVRIVDPEFEGIDAAFQVDPDHRPDGGAS